MPCISLKWTIVLQKRLICIFSFFPYAGLHARTTRVLLFMVIPGNLIFLYTIRVLQAGHTTLTVIFTSVYLLAGLIQVMIATRSVDSKSMSSLWRPITTKGGHQMGQSERKANTFSQRKARENIHEQKKNGILVIR